VSIESLADENLVKLYENIREQVASDSRSGGRYRFIGDSAKQQAKRLREEIDRRGLRVEPIYWPWSSSISVRIRTRKPLRVVLWSTPAPSSRSKMAAYIEKINGPLLFDDRATPGQYKAGLRFAIERGWLVLNESGTFVRFTQPARIRSPS
jgi:hypothetical protein